MVDTFGLGCGDRKVPAVRKRLYSVLKVSEKGRSPYPDKRSFFEVIQVSHWAYSSVGLEHTPDKREVGSSNLPRPTILSRPHVGL
jgi:hypothetical protein